MRLTAFVLASLLGIASAEAAQKKTGVVIACTEPASAKRFARMVREDGSTDRALALIGKTTPPTCGLAIVTGTPAGKPYLETFAPKGVVMQMRIAPMRVKNKIVFVITIEPVKGQFLI